MDKSTEERILHLLIVAFLLLAAVFILLKWLMGVYIPGLVPASFAIFWVSQWRLFYIRGLFPGKIYTFIYGLVLALSIVTLITQIQE